MTVSTRSFIGLSSLLLAVACGSQTTGGNAQQEANQPGCSTAPACGTCGSCYEACVCIKGDTTGCIDTCAGHGTTTTPGGSGGGSSFSSGGGTSIGGAGPNGTAGAGPNGTAGAGQGSGGNGQIGAGGAGQPAGGVTGAGGATTPPATDQYTFQTDTVDMNPGDEIYRYQDFKNPFNKDIAIIESESFMTPGSHHMFAFHQAGSIPNADSAIGTSTGIEFHPYIHSAQTPQQLVTYPAGVARFLPGGDGVRLQFHYINLTTGIIHAQVSLRVKYVDPSQIPNLAGEVFLNQAGLSVPVGQSTQTRSFQLASNITLIGAASHMHKHATNFTSTTSTGASIYSTTQWDEPVAVAFDPGMAITAGTKITWGCTFNNDSGATLTFGEHALTNEMCIFTGLYYPAPQGAGITTQCILGGATCQPGL